MIYFLTDQKEKKIGEEIRHLPGKKDFYEVLEVKPVCGQNGIPAQPGWNLIRFETENVLPVPNPAAVVLKGAARHLQYTDSALRAELQQKSAPEYPASPETLAVLIPIRKSAAWWSLAQDERQKYFEKKAGERNHTGVGLDYAGRIFRRLYHSRYLENEGSYDFLTYFEFRQEDRPLFQSLLSELRNAELNPEWQFVDFELEIWMRKTGNL